MYLIFAVLHQRLYNVR